MPVIITEETKQQIINAVTKYASMREAAQMINMSYETFIYRAKQIGVYAPNQGGVGSVAKTKAILKQTTPLQEILDGKHPNFITSLLKKKMIKENVIEEKCEWCGIETMWNGKPIVLELDHINGISNDHKLNNLRLLCPNCHSQTPTFKNRKRK